MCSTRHSTIFLFFLITIFSCNSTPTHELHPDPLTPLELDQVRTIVTHSHPKSTFHHVALDEPHKPTLLSWLSNKPYFPNPPRQAFVITRTDRTTREIIVDLSTHAVVSDRAHDGHGYPMLTSEEQEVANDMSSKYPPFVAAMRRRGLKVEEVVCGSFMVGWFGEEERKVKRMVRVMATYLDGTVNFYVRPVEGVTVTVVLDEMKIVGFVDRLTVPIPKADGTDYQESSSDVQEPGLNGITVVQPEGPSFRIEGHSVSWNNFLNAGENGFGHSETVQKMQFSWMCMLLHKMGGRSKCPTLSASLSDNAGDIMWCHTENQIPNKLVGLTGLLGVKATEYTHLDHIQKEVFGTLLAENTIVVYHDHFLTYHLDLDVDGEMPTPLSSPNWETTRVTDRSSPRKSNWKVVSETVKTEPEAMIKFGSGAAELLVVNPNKRTKMGNNVGYRLIPE